MHQKTIHLGNNIARIRTLKGIKQAAFATSLNISQQAVSKMERSADISYSRLLHVANILGISVETIQYFDEAKIYAGGG